MTDSPETGEVALCASGGALSAKLTEGETVSLAAAKSQALSPTRFAGASSQRGPHLKVNARCTNTVQRAFFIGNLQLFQRGLYADDGFFLAHHSGQVGAAARGTGFAGQGNAQRE